MKSILAYCEMVLLGTTLISIIIHAVENMMTILGGIIGLVMWLCGLAVTNRHKTLGWFLILVGAVIMLFTLLPDISSGDFRFDTSW